MSSSPNRHLTLVLVGLVLGVAGQGCSTPRPYTGSQGGSDAGVGGGPASTGGRGGSGISPQGSGGTPADAAMPDVPSSSGGSSQDGAVGGSPVTGTATGGSEGSGASTGSGGGAATGGHGGGAGAGMSPGTGGTSGQSGVGGGPRGTGGTSPGTGGTRGSGGLIGSGGMLGSGGLSGSGGATACQSGGACQPANPCQKGTYSCATGTQQCVPSGNQPTTVACGSAQSCTGSMKHLQQMCDGNGACAPQITQACPANETCSGTDCACSAPYQLCNGACVNVQTDPRNCGTCGASDCANKNMACSAGQCVCGPNTPNGLEICFRPGQVRGTCWGGSCVLPALGVGCNTAADCVPGGCSAPGGFCLGTIEVAGEVSCGDDIGSSVICGASEGCTDFPMARQPPFTVCGDGTSTANGAITCDGPSDCGTNYDCCYFVGTQHCLAQPQPGVIGSGCVAYQTNPNGPQASLVCDPLNPTATCPPGKTCTIDSNEAIVYGFHCQ